MQRFTWLSDLKLRAAYGENGNNAIPADLYEDRYTTSGYVNYSSYDLNGTNNSAFTGAGLYQLGNPKIHWIAHEKAHREKSTTEQNEKESP